MTQLSKSALVTKFNDASTGLFKAGQNRGIGSDDMRTFIEDLVDSLFNTITDSLPFTIDTSDSVITLNFANNGSRIFNSDSTLGSPATVQRSNDSNAVYFEWTFIISNVGAVLTFENYKMSDVRWNQSSDEWTPAENGKYKAVGIYDGSEWLLDISAAPYV